MEEFAKPWSTFALLGVLLWWIGDSTVPPQPLQNLYISDALSWTPVEILYSYSLLKNIRNYSGWSSDWNQELKHTI